MTLQYPIAATRRRLLSSFSGTLATVVLLLATGCKSDCHTTGADKCADIPVGAGPQPLGTYACAWQHAHMAAAEFDDFVFYHYEFENCGERLGPFGKNHLEQVANRLTYENISVIVERGEDPNLDLARLKTVVDGLTSLGVEDAKERVTLGKSQAEGLHSIEAPGVTAGYLDIGARSRSATTPFGGQRGNLRGAFGGSLSGIR
jgi:hypothetical protein